MQKWRERGDWENLIETLFKSLHLNLDRLMECVVKHKVDVVLSVLQCDISASTSWNQLNVTEARECEVQSIVLHSATIRDGQALQLSRLKFSVQVLLLNFIGFVRDDLEFGERVEDAEIKLSVVKD